MIREGIKRDFTKFEVARILGARALQIAMDAPLLAKISKDELEKIRYDPLKIAEMEFLADVLPITVKRPLPRKIEGKLRREASLAEKPGEKDVAKKEKFEEKEIKEEGEIMDLAKPEDESEEEASTEEEAGGI